MSYILVLCALPVLLVLAWHRLRLDRKQATPDWRARLLLAGVAADTISLAIFFVVSFGPRLWPVWVPELQHYRAVLPLTVAAIALSGFGKRVPRVVGIVVGCALTFLWLNLAASSL